MNMTWGEIKSHCINLGFNKANAYQKDPGLFVDAANRAISVVATTVMPVIQTVVIPHYPEPDAPEYVAYNMTELTAQGGKAAFFDFTGDRPALNGIHPLENYRRQERDMILFPRSLSGDVTVWYKKYPEKIAQATQDAYELELDYGAAMLVPLLMGFYIWMGDDERLSIMWRNEYEERSANLTAATTRLPITIIPGEVI